MTGDVVGSLVQSRAVLLEDQAGEHPGVGAAQGVWVDAGVLDSLPRDLQQQALLWLHRGRLAWRQPEEPGVKAGGVVEKTTGP